VQEQTKLVHETVELAKTLVSAIAPQTSAAFAADKAQKSRKNFARKKRNHEKKQKAQSNTQDKNDIDNDDLGDHAHMDAIDPPKENYYKPRKDNKITPDDVFDDCGDDTTAIDLPANDDDATTTKRLAATTFLDTQPTTTEVDYDSDDYTIYESQYYAHHLPGS
jgi:hypothetical protein